MSLVAAVIGMVLAILLILKRVSPFYSLLAGALIGGILMGKSLPEIVSFMVEGVKDVSPAVLRILSAGVLTGCLIKTGAAETIALRLIHFLGSKRILMALALASFCLTAIGVFIDVAVITVAPIALNVGRQLKISKIPLLFMMVAGGKCGNIISPNPNTIVAAENLGADLSAVMMSNVLPALLGLMLVIFLFPRILPRMQIEVVEDEVVESGVNLPSFWASLVAPLVALVLLALRPLAHINIDPMVALPLAGLVGALACSRSSMIAEGINYGLTRMSTIAILLIGTGALAGMIKASSLKDGILALLQHASLDASFLAPVSGALLSAVTASTTAGATIASATFGDILLQAGLAAVSSAAMINAGATVLDHLPHGSFFHATGGVMNLTISNRLRLIPAETLTGFTLALLSYLFH